MAKYNKGDICLLKSQYGDNKHTLIIGIDPSKPKNIYKTRDLGGRSTKIFVGNDDQIDRKVGTAEEDHPFLSGLPLTNAQAESVIDKDPVLRYLRTLSTGDVVRMKGRGVNSRVSFNRMIPNGKKYVFSATNGNGSSYRFSWQDVILPATADNK